MAGKPIPVEALIMLRNSLDTLSARSGKRRILVEETANFYGISVSTIMRALREYHQECIRVLEAHGVNTPEGPVKADEGVLKRTTVERYVKRWGLGVNAMRVEPTAVRFQAVYSNDCWQFDFSPSNLKKLKGERTFDRHTAEPTLMLASAVDDRSGVCYQEYHYVHGEKAITGLRFLFNAMAPKKDKNCRLRGIPKIIYLDNGPVAKNRRIQ